MPLMSVYFRSGTSLSGRNHDFESIESATATIRERFPLAATDGRWLQDPTGNWIGASHRFWDSKESCEAGDDSRIVAALINGSNDPPSPDATLHQDSSCFGHAARKYLFERFMLGLPKEG